MRSTEGTRSIDTVNSLSPLASRGIEIPAHIQELRRILGEDVLLLRCRHGTKRPAGNWGAITIEAMDKPSYLRKLSSGNIGVALGVTSGGLVSIDLDHDDAVAGFMELNPALLKTFRTKGKRGCNFWLRMLGPYPGTSVLKTNGQPWGEFRSHGSQTIAWGTHPEGMPYQWLNRFPAIVTPYASIRWPDAVNRLTTSEPKPYELHREAEESEEANEIRLVRVCPSERVFTVSEVVDRCIPKARGDNHRLVHELNRGIAALEIQEGVTYPVHMRREVFERWYLKAHLTGFLKQDQTKDEYFLEFMASNNVKVPLGSGELLSKAIAKARTEPEPPEVAQFADSPNIRLLICLCYQLQVIAGDQPFYLSARKAAEVLGVSWKSCATWLKGLCNVQVLQLVTKGGTESNPRGASRYRYQSLALSV